MCNVTVAQKHNIFTFHNNILQFLGVFWRFCIVKEENDNGIILFLLLNIAFQGALSLPPYNKQKIGRKTCRFNGFKNLIIQPLFAR